MADANDREACIVIAAACFETQSVVDAAISYAEHGANEGDGYWLLLRLIDGRSVHGPVIGRGNKWLAVRDASEVDTDTDETEDEKSWPLLFVNTDQVVSAEVDW